MRSKKKVMAWGSLFGGLALVTATWAVSSPVAHATTSVQTSFTIPGTATITVDGSSWCTNSGGPNIVLDTSAFVGGSVAQLTFENNLKGTHQIQVVGTVGLTLSNGQTTVSQPKQPSMGGAGGNPFIYLVAPGLSGGISDGTWYYLGRCVQDGQLGGLNHGPFQSSFNLPANTIVSLTGINCSSDGSDLDVGATTDTGSVSGELVFTNNYVALHGVTPHIDPTNVFATWGFTLTPGQIHKGWNGTVHGPGGNPIVLDQEGSDLNNLSPPNNDGRCNKL